MTELIAPSIATQESQISIEEQNRKNKNAIGSRGEAIAYVRLTEEHRLNLYFLGEKAQTIDFLAEIRNQETPFFAFLQVKTTGEPEYTNEGKLKVNITGEDLARLINKPLPTYFVGVDEQTEVVYIAPIYTNSVAGYTSSIPNKYKLVLGQKANNIKVIKSLEKDIIAFSKVVRTRKLHYITKMKI